MEESNQTTTDTAKASLEAIASAKKTTAALSKAPRGYYSLLGLGMGCIILGIPMGTPWSIIASLMALTLVVVAIVWYSRSVPTWSMGNPFGTGAWLFWIMVAVALVGATVSYTSQNLLVSCICATTVVIAWTLLGPLWDTAYRHQLEAK